MSVAMMLHHQKPLADDGRFITDLFTDRRPKKLDILSGYRQLINPPPPSALHRPWYTEQYSPIILHFGGAHLNSYPYNSQRWLLYFYRKSVPSLVAKLIVDTFINLPYRSWHWLIGSLQKLKTK